MDKDTQLFIDTSITHKDLLETILDSTTQNPKNAKISEEARKEGNIIFSQKSHSDESHAQVLRLYNKSAAFAPSDSQELASAYANRSAFLLHIEKYQECIQDIDEALEINKSDELEIKLLCRKVECLKNVGYASKDILEKAQSLVDKIENPKIRKTLEKMVNKIVTMPITKKVEVGHKEHKAIDSPVTDNVLKKVSIKHNQKYGRHVIAKQNFNPGDIIFVEKLFSISLEPAFRCTNCHHCLKICWNGIPCNDCTWAIFCSKDCRQKAWQEYHDIECSLGTLLINLFDDLFINSTIIKIFVNAIKDAGSIENLRARLKVVDKDADVCRKGFYKNGNFDSSTIESFYSLTLREHISSEKMESLIVSILTVVIGLTKHPLMKNLHVKEVEELIKNKDAMFLGCLLLRLSKIFLNNSYSFINFLTHEVIQFGVPQHIRGSCTASLISLLNNSCNPNANVCFTEDGKVIVYALQPIKKNDQIFTSYSREYSSRRLEVRKEDLKNYNFECDCQACVEEWPPILLDNFKRLANGQNEQDPAETKFVQESYATILSVEENNYNETSLKILAPQVTLASKRLKQPSLFISMLQEVVSKCITNVYNGLKPQFYGDCKLLDENGRSSTNIYKGYLCKKLE